MTARVKYLVNAKALLFRVTGRNEKMENVSQRAFPGSQILANLFVVSARNEVDSNWFGVKRYRMSAV